VTGAIRGAVVVVLGVREVDDVVGVLEVPGAGLPPVLLSQPASSAAIAVVTAAAAKVSRVWFIGSRLRSGWGPGAVACAIGAAP